MTVCSQRSGCSIFSLSVIVSVVMITVGVYVYESGAQSLSSTPPIAATETSSLKFNAAELTSIMNAFDERAERILLDKAYAGPSDPSLP